MTASCNHDGMTPDRPLRTGDVLGLLHEPGGFHRLRAALAEMRAAWPTGAGTEDAPPWQLRPDLPRASIGWQSGPGLAALHRFAAWYGQQTEMTRAALRCRYPEPDGWHGFYDSLV